MIKFLKLISASPYMFWVEEPDNVIDVLLDEVNVP